MPSRQRLAQIKAHAEGKCEICFQPNPIGGKRCAECKRKHREYNRDRRKRRIAVGLCSDCGKTQPKPGKKLCEKCTNRVRIATIRFREKRTNA